MVLTACILMGLWQLGVYGAKHEKPAQGDDSAAPVRLLEAWGPDAPFGADLEKRPVLVRGAFTGEQALIQRGSGRYWTIAPLRVAGTRSSLVIVRGWSGPESPPLPTGTLEFQARLQPGEPTAGIGRAGIYPSLSIPTLANVFRDDLFSGYAITSTSRVNGGLDPVEPKPPDVSWTVGLRNLAYAMQWWLFGLFALFMWWRMVTDAVAKEPLDTVAE
jgi:cytochrome oxidase assembly protein ShyY1